MWKRREKKMVLLLLVLPQAPLLPAPLIGEGE
jgi:hypothetical protein